MSILFPTGSVLEFLAGLKVSTDSSGVETEAAEEKFARSVSKRYPRNKRRKFMSLPDVDLLIQNDSMCCWEMILFTGSLFMPPQLMISTK